MCICNKSGELQQVQSNLRQIVAELQKSIRGIQSNSSDFSSAFDNIMKNVSDVNGLVQVCGTGAELARKSDPDERFAGGTGSEV